MVNFFIESNKTIVAENLFGLCDDTNGSKKSPAYIDLVDKEMWIATAFNSESIEIEFYPLDGCVKWSLPDGKQAKVCDGMLSYNQQKNIIFVELKDRNPKYKKWRIEAEEQLKSTICCYKCTYKEYSAQIKAYVSNKQLLFDESSEEYMERFKDKTGVTLRYSREIKII